MAQRIETLAQVLEFKPAADRILHSATHEEILSGVTTDVYFIKTNEILTRKGMADKVVTAEVFARADGILAGMDRGPPTFIKRGRRVPQSFGNVGAAGRQLLQTKRSAAADQRTVLRFWPV